jgi:Guanylate-binding protein, N-terminal domain
LVDFVIMNFFGGKNAGKSKEISSHKWISTETTPAGRVLVAHKVNQVYENLGSSPCNLISIFGRARQGKSFLMNCLAGEEQIFKISNEKESCTQGIDISEKWMSVTDFSRVDGGTLCQGDAKVGFVDAEGQGDRDVSYDANLVCPILLASKCVIFNWKGDLQKDHIMSTLGIMARAAKNVSLTEDELESGMYLILVRSSGCGLL